MDRGRWLRVVSTLLFAAAMALVIGTRLRVSTDITRFLAPGDDPVAARVSAQLSRSELSRTMILAVRVGPGDDPSLNRTAAERLATALGNHDLVAWVRTGVPPTQQRAVYGLYQPRRLYFGDTSMTADAWVEDQSSDAALADAAGRLRSELGRPMGAAIKGTAPADPLLLFVDRLRRLESARSARLAVVDDGFVTDDGAAVVILATRASAFDAEAQRRVQVVIEGVRLDAADALGPVQIEQSGIGRFAMAAEREIRSDIVRISALGTLGVALLFIVVFRSPVLMLVSMLPLAVGALAATAAVALVYDQVHGLTLAFGGSLLGICIDYPVHLLSHVAHARAEDDGAAIDRASGHVRAGLLLGAGTTLVGFVGLGWTSFPGIREIAVFASVGILVAVVVTLWTVPALIPRRAAVTGLHRPLREVAQRGLDGLRARPGLAAVPALISVVVVAVGAPQIRFVDDPEVLTRLDEELLAEDERVRAAVSRMETSQIVLARGTDVQAALRADAQVHAILGRMRDAGELEAFSSLSTWIRTSASQREHLAAWRAVDDAGLEPRLEAAFEAKGFRPGVFDRFFADLRSEPIPPLVIDDLREAGLADLVSTHLIELDGEVVLVSYVRGVEDARALATALPASAVFFDQRAAMRRAYATHRRQGLQLVGVGLVAVLLVLLARYRRPGQTLAAFLPSVLAAGVTLSILALAGVSLHLLHLVSTLLVMSMGVDYGVFLAESRAGDAAGGRAAATVVSLMLACGSTVFAFGLLALSSNPALHAVGVTTGLGVGCSLVLAPSLAAIVERARGSKE